MMAATRDYIVRMPRDTTVAAACHDVGCEAWQFGWETLADQCTPLGREQAAYIRHRSGRTFTEHQAEGGRMIVFRFASGQRCFAEHRTRPARWLVRGGGLREHAGMRGWIDDLDEHVGQLEDQLKRG